MAEGLKLRLDYDDYAAIPPDGKRYELLNGELIVTPGPGPLHQRVSKRLQRSPTSARTDRTAKAQRYATVGVRFTAGVFFSTRQVKRDILYL